METNLRLSEHLILINFILTQWDWSTADQTYCICQWRKDRVQCNSMSPICRCQENLWLNWEILYSILAEFGIPM